MKLHSRARDDLGSPPIDRTAPESRDTGTARHRITVATYNIHLGIGCDEQFSPERIARVIHELDADIIALQEVELGAPAFDMLGYLRKACGLHAIAGPTLKTSMGDYGNAVLMRCSPTQVQRIDLSVPGREPRGALVLDVEFDSWPLRLIATHLGLRPKERRQQIRALLALIQNNDAVPTVLLGDLNEWFLWGRPLRWLRSQFSHTPAPATFPSGWPLFALDRVWVKPQRALQRVAVHVSELSRVASDHLPLTAIVDLRAPAL